MRHSTAFLSFSFTECAWSLEFSLTVGCTRKEAGRQILNSEKSIYSMRLSLQKCGCVNCFSTSFVNRILTCRFSQISGGFFDRVLLFFQFACTALHNAYFLRSIIILDKFSINLRYFLIFLRKLLESKMAGLNDVMTKKTTSHLVDQPESYLL